MTILVASIIALVIIFTVLIPVYLCDLYASSPSFPNQQLADPAYDADSNICPMNLELVGVTYSSDGEILNTTIWLKTDPNSNMSDPSKIRSVDIYNDTQDFYINGTELGVRDILANLAQKSDVVLYGNVTDLLLLNKSSIDQHENLTITLSKKSPTDRYPQGLKWGSYLPFLNSSYLNITDAKVGNSYVHITARSTEPDVRNILSKIGENEKFQYVYLANETHKFMATYPHPSDSSAVMLANNITGDLRNSELIQMNDQVKNKKYQNLTTILNSTIYQLPERENVTRLFIKHAMYVNVRSVSDTGWDYLDSIEWQDEDDSWIHTLEQFRPNSTNENNRLFGVDPSLNKTMVGTGRFDDNTIYVDIPLNLSRINYPSSMITLFQTFIQADTDGGNRCQWFDRTSGIAIPPPMIELHAKPASVELLPNERRTVILTANSRLLVMQR
jgi:ribulose bisphosphate carboxylase small subunit